jgi:hypothetical protein
MHVQEYRLAQPTDNRAPSILTPIGSKVLKVHVEPGVSPSAQEEIYVAMLIADGAVNGPQERHAFHVVSPMADMTSLNDAPNNTPVFLERVVCNGLPYYVFTDRFARRVG